MGAFATMTSKGQLTIPKDLRKESKLTPGTKFFVTMRDPLATVIEAPRGMLAIEELCIEHADELGRLLGGDRAPATDIADYLITWAGHIVGCSHTVTFDRGAAKAVPGMELLA